MKITIYKDLTGREPFNDWLIKQETITRTRIRNRIDRIQEYRIFGDYKNIESEIYELRFHFGSGYRVYFIFNHPYEIVILCGGDKSTQSRDIEKAKQYLKQHRYGKQTIH